MGNTRLQVTRSVGVVDIVRRAQQLEFPFSANYSPAENIFLSLATDSESRGPFRFRTISRAN